MKDDYDWAEAYEMDGHDPGAWYELSNEKKEAYKQEDIEEVSDDVNSPKHYQVMHGVMVLDIIRNRLTREEYRGYLKGNILKYHLRADYKGEPEKDRAKARVYEDML